jgi:phthiocerol/phenolphthiocerol synthesis type-I polyketide synthase E
VEFDIRLYDTSGATLVEIDGLALKRLPVAALAAPPVAAALAAASDDAIDPEQGLAIFTRLLGQPEAAQWAISPLPLPGLIRHIQAAHNVRPDQRATARRSSEGVETAATPLQQLLSGIFEQALGVSPIGIHDNFFALGGDSVLAIQIVSAAKAEGLAMKPNDLFEHQSVAELAELFEGSQAQAVASRADADANSRNETLAVAAAPTPAAGADRDWLREAGISDDDIEHILRQ